MKLVILLLVLIPLILAAGPLANLTKGCSKDGLVCLGLPAGCVESETVECEVFAKVNTQGGVHVELTAFANKSSLHLNLTNRWIGVGFSQTGLMPNTAVVHCFQDPKSHAGVAKLTFNSDKGHFNIGWADIDQKPLELMSSSVDEFRLNCEVNLQKKFKIKDFEFDLTSKHTLLVATGPLVGGAIRAHDKSPNISKDKFAF